MTISEPTKQETLDLFKRLKSSLLDTWTWDQLRTMKMGGNAALHEFFNKSPQGSNKDAKTKYTSKIAVTYKEKLEQRKAEDAISNPGRLIPESKEAANPAAASTPADAGAGGDDFFNTWDEPKSSSGTSTPVVSAGGSTQRAGLTRPQRSTLTAKKTTMGASKPMKLGVKKVNGVSFEEAETRAKAEAERIVALGAEAAEQERLEKQAAAERATQRAAELKNARNQPKASPSTPVSYYQANTSGMASAKANDDGMARLGMGMGRMGFGAVPSSSSSRPSTQHVETTSAREKFGGQKAISSDQYFGRGNYDSKAQAEASSRLQSFSGATAISSNMYFGREETQPQNKEVDQLGAEFSSLGNAVLKGADMLNNMLNDMTAHYNY
ncbi:ADP-ribosylation factor GTPase activating protein, ER-Golgi transport [Modicella reniformis]|uniref:ADP-ribosylation factor GTPase activating protein, ER-Golgi transport n=1 Tax=Modicella reniformis TaxID=1440133 RepID=A0A9P6J6M1_9FUNG|nr:ADP-ribosylation factor GTPase activating protein, ER-Golgi transport [Modicella reniformis]